MDENDLTDAPAANLGPDISVCRALPAQVEIRAADEDDRAEDDSPGTMFGHFSTFDEFYEINSWFEGNFLERIAPGAFKRTINNRSGATPIRVLLEHGFDPQVGDKPLGVPSVLEERDGGPYAEVPLFDTSYNRDLAPALRAGAYGQSFRFAVLRDEWDEEPEPSAVNPRGIPERTIKELRLIEFGPTVFPANPAADAGLRSTTDEFYERLRSRQPELYADAVSRAASVRLPQTPPKREASKTEDPPTGHSEDPPTAPDVAPVRHSEDPPPVEHSPAPSVQTPDTERNTSMDETMTVEERVARQTEIRSRLTEIDTEYAGGVLPDETRAEWDRLNAEFQEHDEAIADSEARRAQLARLAGDEKAVARNGERARPGQAPEVIRRPENIYDLSEIRRQARSVDDLPALYRDGAMRVIEAARFAGADDKEKAQAHVEKLLRTVDDGHGTLARRVITTGSPLYDRAFGKAILNQSTDSCTTEERAALSTATTGGGFAVPFDLDPTVILTSAGVIDPLRQMSRVETVVGNTWQGITSAGVTVTRYDEAAEVGDDGPTVGQPEVKLSRVSGFIPFSMEIEQDWARMRAEMTMLLADGKATEEADSFVNGDGTDPAPEGLLAGIGSGNHVALTAAGTLAAGDLYDLEEAVPNRFRARSQFFANRAFYNLVRALGEDSDGGNLWVRLGAGLPPELIGYAAREGSEMPALALSTDGSELAVLGDFSKFLIVDKAGMNVELVPHLLGANRRPTGQRGLFAVWRNSCKVLVPGAFRILVGNDGV